MKYTLLLRYNTNIPVPHPRTVRNALLKHTHDPLSQIGQFEFLPNLFVGEFARMSPEKLDTFIQREINLATKGHHAPGKIFIILHQKPDCDHHVVDIMKDQGLLRSIHLLAPKEGLGMITPVS